MTSIQVLVRKNGSNDTPKICKVPGTFAELLTRAGGKVQVENPKRIFTASGAEVDDVEDLNQGDEVFISAGESFISPGTTKSVAQPTTSPVAPAEKKSPPPSKAETKAAGNPTASAPVQSPPKAAAPTAQKAEQKPVQKEEPKKDSKEDTSAKKKKGDGKGKSITATGEEFQNWSESKRFTNWRAKMKQISSHISTQYVKTTDSRQGLLNFACSSVVSAPSFYKPEDEGRISMMKLAIKIAREDPEYLFKLALYTRTKLFIRSTSNFILSLAAHLGPCHPFMKKYFEHIIKTPGDLLEFVNLYRTTPNRILSVRSLPQSTRRVVCDKFRQFDTYQLGKYCSESDRKALNMKKKPAIMMGQLAEAVDYVRDEDAEEEEFFSNKVSMKRLIQSLHISEPRNHVLAILGVKYPKNPEEFTKQRLSGEFDEKRVGKRMKLPSPYTWECALSQRGNNAKTWEGLISSKRLPFIALMRNLRSIIKVEISETHHQMVLGQIVDPKFIERSGMTPIRFLAAEKAILDFGKKISDAQAAMARKKRAEKLANTAKGNTKQSVASILKSVPSAKGGKSAPKVVQKSPSKPEPKKPKEAAPAEPRKLPKGKPKPKYVDVKKYNEQAKRYSEAINRAVEISITQNIKPIKGRTIVLCDLGKDMAAHIKRKGSILQDLRSLAIVLSLIVHRRASSTCILRGFCGRPENGDDATIQQLSVPKDKGLLGALGDILKAIQTHSTPSEFPLSYIAELIDHKVIVDNIIVFTASPGYPNANPQQIHDSITRYRRVVSPNMRLFIVDLSGRGYQILDLQSGNLTPNDVLISGFSESVLSLISERESSQVEKVQSIDIELGLAKPISVEDSRVPYEDIPKNFICPITREVMEAPVLAPDGHSYEESAIKHWFSKSRISPLTGLPLASLELTPNHALKALIVGWKESVAAAVAQKIEESVAQTQSAIEKGLESFKAIVKEGHEVVANRLETVEKTVQSGFEKQAVIAEETSRNVITIHETVQIQSEQGTIMIEKMERIEESVSHVSDQVQAASSAIDALLSTIIGADFAAEISLNEFKLHDSPPTLNSVLVGTDEDIVFFKVRRGFKNTISISLMQETISGFKFSGIQRACMSNFTIQSRDEVISSPLSRSAHHTLPLPIVSFISRQAQNQCLVTCELNIEETQIEALKVITPRGQYVSGILELYILVDGLSVPVKLQNEVMFRIFKETETFYIANAARSLKSKWDDLPEWAKTALKATVKLAIKAALA